MIDLAGTERFGQSYGIGIGINTRVDRRNYRRGGKLEFTLIGDTVNVAARVEQLTKTTGDTIPATQQCRSPSPPGHPASSTGDRMR